MDRSALSYNKETIDCILNSAKRDIKAYNVVLAVEGIVREQD